MSAPDLTLSGLDDLMTSYMTAVEAGTHLEAGWPGGFIASHFVASYAVSKMGVSALARVLARTMGDTVVVNHVHPGLVATDMGSQYSGPQTALTIDRWRKSSTLILIWCSIFILYVSFLEVLRLWCTLPCCPPTQG